MEQQRRPSVDLDLWKSVLANAPALVEKLVTEGEVDVDERNDLGETALHLACSRGFDDVAYVLLAHGADVGLQDWESGWTALHRSVYNAHLSTSLLLLRHARQHRGRQFMKEFLYEAKDFAHQSAMELLANFRGGSKLRHMLDAYDELEEKERKGEEQAERHEQWEPLPRSERRGGMVYTFGKVDFQLGYHLPHVNVQSSPRLVELPITSPIIQISASKFHTIALNGRGQVYVWGFGKGGRLGTGTEFDHVEPTRLASLHEIPIARVAAGENHTLALSCSGQVFSWGSNSFGQLGHNVKSSSHESRLLPKRIDAFRGMHMVEIVASGVHSGAICRDDGFVYTWGSNKRGQLGRKDGFGVEQPNPTPKRVDRLVPGHALSVLYEPHDAMRVVQLAMSDVHTCVILRCSKNGQSHGQVWQFGYGSNVPTRILFKEKRRTQSHLLMTEAWMPRWKLRSNDMVAISCAPNHSIALSACGSVYTWGHNGDALSHQQHSKKDYIPPGTPQRVMLDKYGHVVSICASQDHCAVVTQSGDLVSWGCGPQGVLGHGPGNSWQPSPKQVHGAKKVVTVAAGHQHTVVLVAPRLPQQDSDSKPNASSPSKLRNLLETRIAEFLDISNVATVWKYANAYSQRSLEQYCIEYMRLNWDAMLEMGSKERLDVLFELMLAPNPKVMAKRVTFGGEDHKMAIRTKAAERKPERKASISLEEKKAEPASKTGDKSERGPVVHTTLAPVRSFAPSPVLQPQAVPASARRVKGTKFVSVDSFFSEKTEPTEAVAPPPSEPRSFVSPWSSAKPSPPVSSAIVAPAARKAAPPSESIAFPSLGESVARPPRKESVDHAPLPSSLPRKSPLYGASPSPKLSFASSPTLEPRKHVLCYDGSERAQVSAFSLDAFIKKSSRKESRSDSMDNSKAAPSWGAVVGPTASVAVAAAFPALAVACKSLKEIQAEEEARAKAEAAAKAKNGGFVRKASSFNSWGLVQQHNHISLEELQQREEEERFLEEQRQIMAQIERENKQRDADEKRRVAKKEKQKQSGKPQLPRREARGGTVDPSRANAKATTQQPRQHDTPKKAETEGAETERSAERRVRRGGGHAGLEGGTKTKPVRPKASNKEPTAALETGAAAVAVAAVEGEPKKSKPEPRKKPSKPKQSQPASGPSHHEPIAAA